MNRIVLELNEEPKENDLIIFSEGKYKLIQKDILLKNINSEIENLKNDNFELRKENEKLKESVNSKLKEYHDILRLLTKEES